jgi:hypothetical protein
MGAIPEIVDKAKWRCSRGCSTRRDDRDGLRAD